MDGSPVAQWSCQQCTLLNSVQSERCRACSFPNPLMNKRDSSIFGKLKLPTFSLTSAIEKIDSALDLITGSPYSPRYDMPVARPIGPGEWHCQNCSQINQEVQHPRMCPWCNFDRLNDAAHLAWMCAKCGLKQPAAPLNFKCPLCRSKSSRMPSRGTSASMPRLDQIHTNGLQVSPQPSTSNQMPMSENVAETSQICKDVVAFCKANNQTFVDDGFPHSSRSIGSMNMLERRDLSIVWLRPHQIVTRDGRIYRWSVFNDPQPTDIEQGALGNCWFLSALAVVAERPDILEKIVITREFSHYGVYEIRLCVDGIWQSVVLDDFFPCHQKSKTMVFAVGRNNQLWVSLIEKALAKMYGNYAALRAGRSYEGLSTLTGAPSQYLSLEPDDEDTGPGFGIPTLDLVWAQLLSAMEARFLMGCSCGAGKRHVDEEKYKKMGLMSRHAYSILDVRQVDNHRLLRLRNPWGTFVWLGDFGHGWTGWNQELRARLGSDSTQPGTFWIPFEQFAQYFDSVDIAQIREHSGWTDTRYLLDIGWDEQKCRVVKVTITEPTEICVTVYQRNARTMLDQVDAMILIHKEDPSMPHFPAELLARSPRKIQASVRTEDVFLQPGEYIVCVVSFSKFGDAKTIPGTVVIHCSKRVFSELLPVPLVALQKSMINLMLKEGNAEETTPGSMMRVLTHEFAGLAIMVDNMNRSYCLQVHSDCQNSTNVLATRCALVSADSVPPLHRQIVTVLTHFEPSQAFMVSHRLMQRSTPFAQLRDFAPPALKDSQNFPALSTQAMVTLHAPVPLYM
ncbi:calpain family cysteine protease domain-containing protein [Ditylenchus destructor]|uniref:Calpain family cysteine protease domain-containing protein n=1 Tax=Ditylenchus destructor TaxID=166010 RepID=A0AAD4MZL7_9BILA|nr:calpain family cysteine protease domain-containing protein [Ditylenchus destructor]